MYSAEVEACSACCDISLTMRHIVLSPCLYNNIVEAGNFHVINLMAQVKYNDVAILVMFYLVSMCF